MMLTFPSQQAVGVYSSSLLAASAAADQLESMIVAGTLRTLGVATGSSPEPLYRELARRGLSLEGVTVFALDEYLGLPDGHVQSYRSVLEREVAEPLGVPRELVHLPDGEDPGAYDQLIAAHGGIDVQLLGLGQNGHIGFNEPGTPFDSRTRVVELELSTRQANARFFSSINDVPHHSVTQGIATILDARRLIVLASGARKASAVASALRGPRTESMPATALQSHTDVSWFIDNAAASLLVENGVTPGHGRDTQ